MEPNHDRAVPGQILSCSGSNSINNPHTITKSDVGLSSMPCNDSGGSISIQNLVSSNVKRGPINITGIAGTLTLKENVCTGPYNVSGITLSNKPAGYYDSGYCDYDDRTGLNPECVKKIFNPNNMIIERGDNMKTTMSLYEVIVVGKNKVIYIDTKVIAMSIKDAEFEAGVDILLRENGLKPNDVTVICTWKANVGIEDVNKEK